MKKILNLVAVALFLLGFSDSSLAREKIVIAGTGDSQQLLRILARAFEKANPGTTIEVPDSIGSGGGIKATAKGKCDLGRVARPIKEKEKKYNLSYTLFAYSPVVFAVNPGVKDVDNLTSAQIVALYSGNIALWSDLGGKKSKIYIVNREAGDSSRNMLEKHIPGFKDIKTFSGKTVYSTPETVKTIEKFRNTLGYTSLSMVQGTDLIVMKIDEVYPSSENVQNGQYKLVAPFGLVWKGDLSGLAKDFVDFVFNPEAKNIITENGAVPIPLKE